MSEKKPKPQKGLMRIWYATRYSMNGLRLAVTQEAAFRQELCLYIVLLVVLFFLPLPLVFKCVLLLVNTIVLLVELLNSAIESIIDMTSPDYHELAKKGKDLGSAAVFISLALVVVLWLYAIYFMVKNDGA